MSADDCNEYKLLGPGGPNPAPNTSMQPSSATTVTETNVSHALSAPITPSTEAATSRGREQQYPKPLPQGHPCAMEGGKCSEGRNEPE